MNEQNAILIIGTTISDISGKVQEIRAYNKGTDELKFRGNGILVHRSLHNSGDAAIFIKRVGTDHLFGKRCIVYTVAENWNDNDYYNYDMVPTKPESLAMVKTLELIKRGIV